MLLVGLGLRRNHLVWPWDGLIARGGFQSQAWGGTGTRTRTATSKCRAGGGERPGMRWSCAATIPAMSVPSGRGDKAAIHAVWAGDTVKLNG